MHTQSAFFVSAGFAPCVDTSSADARDARGVSRVRAFARFPVLVFCGAASNACCRRPATAEGDAAGPQVHRTAAHRTAPSAQVGTGSPPTSDAEGHARSGWVRCRVQWRIERLVPTERCTMASCGTAAPPCDLCRLDLPVLGRNLRGAAVAPASCTTVAGRCGGMRPDCAPASRSREEGEDAAAMPPRCDRTALQGPQSDLWHFGPPRRCAVASRRPPRPGTDTTVEGQSPPESG